MRTEKHQDGLWHVVTDDEGDGTVCGRVRERQGRGMPGKPTCPTCKPAWVPPAPDLPRPATGRLADLYDRGCKVCGKARRPERSRRYAGLQAEADPFCSTECARAFHRNPIPEKSIWAKVE